ncbi:MAG: mechanosensitive ion channel family protein [Holosporaceae bacterium]|jgi:small-conductance mechanosensitive channel|nr:mechanosensitive ion channel family protein [Holosporaceae bacterium]
MNLLLIIPIAIHTTLSMIVTLSFLFSKKFVNTELNKLETGGKLDRIIILMSGIILSALTTIIFIMCLDIFLEYMNIDDNIICGSYSKLIVIFSVTLISSYMITAPNHSHLRFLKISDKEAFSVYEKFLRIIAISLLVTATASFFPTQRHFFTATIIGYYFSEMMLSRKLINKLFELIKPKEESFSCKLTTFINQKIVFICLFGMLFAVFINRTPIRLFFFESLNNIYCVLTTIFLLQSVISLTINKIMLQLDSIQHGMHSKLTASRRQKNLIWICDVLVIVFYLSIICVLLKHIGVNLRDHIFHDKIVTIGGIIFMTVIIYKGFNEFADAMLEKAKNSDKTDYRVKLQTFLPTLSAIFYVILFVTSSLLILSNLKINVAPILATFTVFSAAIGLAAQDIIRSFLHGITYLIEKNLYIGAYVKIDQKSGVIEKLSTRVLYLRDDNGSVHVIPYSAISSITNCSRNYSYYYGELCFNTEDDIQKISQLLTDVIENMKNDDKYKNIILGSAEIHGLKPFDLAGPKIYWRVKTAANSYGAVVKYEIFKRLYVEYKKHNVHIPIANCTVTQV